MDAPAIDLLTLLTRQGLDPDSAIVMRHKPTEPELRRRLRWLVVERPDLYIAYQAIQLPHVEKTMLRSTHLVSAIDDGPDRALFTGIYRIQGHRAVTPEQFHAIPANQELHALGQAGMQGNEERLLFDLQPVEALGNWIGRYVMQWSGARTYAQLVKPDRFGLIAVHEENQLIAAPPDPRTLLVDHGDLLAMPRSWWDRLGEWRGVYLIRHRPTGRGYVGSAYGANNIAQRWRNYIDTGHGGNTELRGLAPKDFTFSVLELLAPTTPSDEVLAAEQSWKLRLSTDRSDGGLNAN